MVEIGFDPTSYTVNEHDGTVALIVRKTGQSEIPVTVDISTSADTAGSMHTCPYNWVSFTFTQTSHFHLSSFSFSPFSSHSLYLTFLPPTLNTSSSIAPGDFTGISRTLTFPAGGDDVIQVQVPIINDTIAEGREEFFANLDNVDPNDVNLGEDTATIMIINNDGVCVWKSSG